MGISRQTFNSIFSKLITDKIISNFTININPLLESNKIVILEIKTNPKEPELVQDLRKITQLRSLDGIFGEFSLISVFQFKSMKEYQMVLNNIDKIMANSYFKKYQITETIKVYKINGIQLSNVNIDSEASLDDVDNIILGILQDNQGIKPLSTYEIKNILTDLFDIKISQPTIYNRIKTLEDSGIILNYSINFNPQKIGYQGKFILRIKPKNPSHYNELALKLEGVSEITDLYRIGAEFGLFAIVRVKRVQDYALFIKELYHEEIEDTYTNFVLDELVTYTNFVFF